MFARSKECRLPIGLPRRLGRIYPILPDTACWIPSVDAADALRILLTQKSSKGPIVRNGVLLGFLTPSDLFKLVFLKRDIAA